jgi:hypothetical protein
MRNGSSSSAPMATTTIGRTWGPNLSTSPEDTFLLVESRSGVQFPRLGFLVLPTSLCILMLKSIRRLWRNILHRFWSEIEVCTSFISKIMLPVTLRFLQRSFSKTIRLLLRSARRAAPIAIPWKRFRVYFYESCMPVERPTVPTRSSNGPVEGVAATGQEVDWQPSFFDATECI